ncbi:cupin domain-containing protein [uncultured Fusobacterium sp.]|uniref:cupin domain-containing protein n=1 Tax=uncultured Fusobacterium sp. TaxID=159267 RepID=UPI00259905F3|nr:cupin domain-containing protein [uncultured Fusobacterium sp.]
MKNIFENLEYPKGETQEKIDDLFSGKSFRVERILSGGQVSSEWYNQEKEEWVCLLQGEAKLEYENGNIFSLQKGDILFIPAHQKHKVIYTSEQCIWLCVFEK